MNYILGAHLTVNNINNNYTARAHIIILPPKQRRHVAVVYSYKYRVLKIGKTTWVEDIKKPRKKEGGNKRKRWNAR